jgi:NAD(P)-dependent dehydrogenase (short-subunit alcohol dehydrogenase family)
MKKILLITGASAGIGAATARLAARAGYGVCINYLQNHSAAKDIAAEIRKDGGEAYIFHIDYAATKGAVDTMTLGLAKEVAEENIRVNAVRPGIIYTDIHAKAGEPDRIERVKQFTPMKRGGQPEEVAHAILWLLSDEASYITGTLLDVAGGR